jgi:hypothetical protein
VSNFSADDYLYNSRTQEQRKYPANYHGCASGYAGNPKSNRIRSKSLGLNRMASSENDVGLPPTSQRV